MPSNAHAVLYILKDALAVLVSADKDRMSSANLKKEHEFDKAERERSLKSLQDNLNVSELLVHDLEPKQYTVQELASKLEEISENLKESEEHDKYLENWASEQYN